MSKINELIKELCPNGVPFKKIGDICETITDYVAAGSFKDLANNVKYLQEPDYAMLIRTTDIKSKFKGDKFIYINESAFNYLWRVNLNKDSLILPNIGNCGEIYYLTPDDLPYKRCALATNAILVRSEKINMKYLKHAFLANDFQIQLKKITSPSGQTKFNKTDLKKLFVPVPPIEVQEEIVRILDKFGYLEAELEAELEARKSQYEFWRGKLLNEEYETKYLPELSTNLDNKRKPVTKSDRESGEYPYYGASGIVDYVSGYIFDDELLLVSEDGANLMARSTPIAFSSSGKVWINNHVHVLKFNSMITQKYVEHYLNMIDLSEYITGAAQPKLNRENLNRIRINIPSSIEEQEKIVIALERFDRLINDISVGLPAEIELRRKQYEYYRDKLLSFEDMLMNKAVDLNDLESYPEEFLNFVNTNFDKLENTFINKEINISYGSGLFDYLNQMLKDYYFKCIHASRTYNKELFYEKGLFVPSSSDKIIDILLEPIKEMLGTNYATIYEKIKIQLKDDKYRSIHFVIANINDITIKNGFWMLDNYGGELLSDVLGYGNPIYKKISLLGIPVVVIFRIKFSNINGYTLSEIYSFMLNKAMKDKEAHLFKATYVFEDIPKEDIIEVKELKNYE